MLPHLLSVRTFHVPIVMIDLGSFRLSLTRVVLLFALPLANVAPPSWLAPMGSAVVVDPGLDRSGMVMLCVVNGILNYLILSVGILDYVAPVSSSSSLLHFSPPAKVVARVGTGIQCRRVSDLKEVAFPNHSLKECGSKYIRFNPPSNHVDPSIFTNFK